MERWVNGSALSIRSHQARSVLHEPNNGLFVTDDLKLAMDDIYPLKGARILLNRQNEKRCFHYGSVELVVEGGVKKISIKKDDEDTRHKEPQIICSMGLRNA